VNGIRKGIKTLLGERDGKIRKTKLVSQYSRRIKMIEIRNGGMQKRINHVRENRKCKRMKHRWSEECCRMLRIGRVYLAPISSSAQPGRVFSL
jgi:hypothetical protein